jgi:prefoldin subunit 5
MNSFLQRHIGFVVIGFGTIMVILLVSVVNVSGRNDTLENQLDVLRAEIAQANEAAASVTTTIEQLRGGVAIFSTQVTAFQEQLAGLAPGVAGGISDAVAGLNAFATSTLEFEIAIAIDEEIPINTVIELNRTILVPIQTSIPIDETVDTTIRVAGPFGIDIPLNVTVPIQLELPINLEVSIPINETVPISTSVPVNLDVPIVIEVAETELASLVLSLRAGLESMGSILAGLS